MISASATDGSFDDASIISFLEVQREEWGLAPDTSIMMVRSSGTAETVQQRGRLPSDHCALQVVPATLKKLIAQSADLAGSQLHWVVQPYVIARAEGQLSNERRTSEEARDWLLEAESRDNPVFYRQSRIPYRPWRQGTDIDYSAARCSSQVQISIVLRRVAMWATSFEHRMLMEWLWDGKTVWIVQADIADDKTGVDPASLLPAKLPPIKAAKLRVFRLAEAAEYDKYGKLRNANLYSTLGYEMPSFYVLDDPNAIGSIIAGDVSEDVLHDLSELTAQPLILRTDGDDIPRESREMLPRSDELRSAEAASRWLVDEFGPRILAEGFAARRLCLIGHSFIPSVASAWARAEPGRPIVRIESLWGVPEGLYWFSYYTYEVDTGTPEVPDQYDPKVVFAFTSKARYKGTFVASDSEGKWTHHKPLPPSDWKKSIRRQAWLFEIAVRTRQIAKAADKPVSVMWFVDNHADATPNPIMPWYHENAEFVGTPKAAPSRKWRRSRDYKIETTGDWAALEARNFEVERVERVIVAPTDSALIRNRKFVEGLAALAKAKGFVVELSGGVLSHAYFMLQRGGARVECVDLYGQTEENTSFNKVVRDKIPDRITNRGEVATVVSLIGDALILMLRKKLVEEAVEALDAPSGEELLGELSDLVEVIHGICHALEVPFEVVEERRASKRKKNGGFERGVMLKETTSPRSVPVRAMNDHGSELKAAAPQPEVISTVSQLPAVTTYKKQDLRVPDGGGIEKMFTVETEINALDALKEELEFQFPSPGKGTDNLVLVVELQRSRGALRAVVRLRRNPTQLALGFPSEQMKFEF